MLDLDPSFRLGDEAELKLETDVAEDVMETIMHQKTGPSELLWIAMPTGQDRRGIAETGH